MKKILQSLSVCALVLGMLACATGGGAPAPVSGTMSLDEAVAAAVRAVEAKVPAGTETAVYEITSQRAETGEFLCGELDTRFMEGGKVTLLARGASLAAVNAEHEFQMSGLVSDESAVGIGHYLGAKVVVTGTFDRYAAFSQLRVRAVDVRTSAVTAAFTARIDNADPVLAAAAPLEGGLLPVVTEAALALLNSGKDLYAGGKHDEAIQAFTAAIAADGNLGEAYHYRGNSYLYKKDYDRALADYNEAIRINPNDAESYGNRGNTYAYKGDNDRALADFNETVRLNPDDPLAYNNRGVMYSRMGELNRAIADLSEAISLDPDDVNAYINRGSAYRIQGELDRAISDLNEAVRLNPNHAGAYNNRGNAYRDKGDYNSAIEDFTRAIQLDPDYNTAYFNRGSAYSDMRDYGRAFADMNEVLRRNPDDFEAYLLRGVAYAVWGDLDRAIADWETVLRINPNHQGARANLQRARQMRGR